MSIPITDKYLLYKPGLGNEADIRVLNHNTDNIDNGMYQNRLMIGAGYNPERTSSNPYMKDDLVVKQTTILDENDNPVSYSFQLYKCDYDNTYGAWDASKWHITDIATELGLAGGGGSSTLAGLSDVDLSSLQEGDVLTYDGTKWVNGEGTSSPTKTADGNPIEITDGSDAPLVECVTEIQGSQDLHGYDKPWVGGAGKNKVDGDNLTIGLPGYRVGDNIDDVITSTRYAFTAPVLAENGVVVSGKSDARDYFDAMLVTLYDSSGSFIELKNVILANVGQVYTITIEPNICKWIRVVAGADASHNISTSVQGEIQAEYGTTATSYAPYSNICPITAYTEGEIDVRGKNLFDKNASDLETDKALTNNGTTSTYSGCDVSGYIKVDAGQSYTYYGSAMTSANIAFAYYDKNKTFISPIDVKTGGANAKVVTIPSGAYYVRFEVLAVAIDTIQFEKGSTPTPYEPYTSTTHTTTYPSAIYRGSEDVVNGEVGCIQKMIAIDENSGGEFSATYNCYLLNTTEFEQTSATNLSQYLCNRLAAHINSGASSMNYEFLVNGYGNILFRIPGFNSTSDYNTWLASNPLQIVALLKKPTTSSVTPTNLPIKSLSGYNHIESSTGDMEVEYITEEYQPLVDLIQSSKHVYSTAEQIVGTWIDGKTVYEKTVTGSFSNSSTARTWHDILSTSEVSSLGIDKFFISSGSYIIDPDGDIYTVPQTTGVSTGSAVGAIISGGKLQMVIEGMGSGTVDYALTIRYTKTTTQTRSLSSGSLNLSKGEISVEKKKVEEEPIEEEKPVENDLDEWLEDSEEVEEEVDEGTDEDSDVEEEEENEATNE